MKESGKQIRKEIRFKKSERNILIILLIALWSLYGYKFYVSPKLSITENVKLESLLTKLEPSRKKDLIKKTKKIVETKPKKEFKYYSQKKKNKKKKEESTTNNKIKLEVFDPNAIDSLSWISLGLKPWTISNINKYQKKGGRFKSCEDLSKIYSLDDNLFERILPYCKIKIKPKSTPKITKPAKNSKIEINKAIPDDLIRLPGIGPVYANRIVKYRDLLGGFNDLNQLGEVYGLKEETISLIQDNLIIKTPIKRISINASKEILSKHPYIDYKLANIISMYRKHHGDFEKVADLKKIKLISNEKYLKLKPYLIVDK